MTILLFTIIAAIVWTARKHSRAEQQRARMDAETNPAVLAEAYLGLLASVLARNHMRRITFALVVLVSAGAFGQDYLIGTVKVSSYTAPGVTAGCTQGGLGVSCTGYDSSVSRGIYYLTFADGTTRAIEHAPYSRDPLKMATDDTKVKYRIWHHTGIDYVRVLDTDGKEGTYYFSTRADDPKRQKAAYGPAPVAGVK